MFKLNQPIKILVYTGYGGYGFDIPSFVVDRIRDIHGKQYADELFYYEYSRFQLVNREEDSRFNPILIEAFKWLAEYEKTDDFDRVEPDYYQNRYQVKEITLRLEIESYDGKEIDVMLIGKAY